MAKKTDTPKKRGPGRPGAAVKREAALKVLLTDAEKQAIVSAAGSVLPGTWAREALLKAAGEA